MKLSIGRVFDSGQFIKALQSAGVKGADDAINYLAEFCQQMVNAIRGTLTIEENINSTVKDLELTHNTPLQFQLPNEKKVPKHILWPTKVTPFENATTQFNWQILQNGQVEVKASFAGAPTTAVQVRLVILY